MSSDLRRLTRLTLNVVEKNWAHILCILICAEYWCSTLCELNLKERKRLIRRTSMNNLDLIQKGIPSPDQHSCESHSWPIIGKHSSHLVLRWYPQYPRTTKNHGKMRTLILVFEIPWRSLQFWRSPSFVISWVEYIINRTLLYFHVSCSNKNGISWWEEEASSKLRRRPPPAACLTFCPLRSTGS